VRQLPTGTVTFLFTDVEGSTRLLHDLGPEAYAAALAEHRRRLREAFARRGGVEVDTQGDAFFYAFPTAPGALQGAREAQEALASTPIRVRIGIHTGTPHLTETCRYLRLLSSGGPRSSPRPSASSPAARCGSSRSPAPAAWARHA
jgi:class 3 adenylate cyclase